MDGTIPAQAKEGSWHEPFNSSSVEKSIASSILRIPTKGRTLLRNKTSMTCENTHRDGYVGRLKGFFLCKKKEIKDGLKGRLIWSMDYIYTKPNKQIIIDILMSLYSFFLPSRIRQRCHWSSYVCDLACYWQSCASNQLSDWHTKTCQNGTQNGLTTLKDNCIYQCWHTVWHT